MSRPPSPPHPDGPLSGNLAGGVAALLDQLGVSPADTIDATVTAAETILSDRGHTGASVVGLRYRVLTVTAPPPTARLLRFDADQVLAAVNACTSEPVDRLVVRSR